MFSCFQPFFSPSSHTGLNSDGGVLPDMMLHEHWIQMCFDAFLPRDAIRRSILQVWRKASLGDGVSETQR